MVLPDTRVFEVEGPDEFLVHLSVALFVDRVLLEIDSHSCRESHVEIIHTLWFCLFLLKYLETSFIFT